MRSRVIAIVALGVLSLLAGVGYIGLARDRVDDEISQAHLDAQSYLENWEATRTTDPVTTSAVPEEDPEETPPTSTTPPVDRGLPFQEGDLVFVNRIPGPEYGRLGIWRQDTRIIMNFSCDRAHASTDRLVCVRPSNSFAASTRATSEMYSVASDGFRLLGVAASGVPSRARVSPDGVNGVSTVFVSGHSYLEIGQFATSTTVYHQADDGTRLYDLERDFTVEAGDPALTDDRYQMVGGNWWGASFAPDSDEFYVTFGVGASVEILRGSVSERRLTPFYPNASCPSVSPDGRLIVAKRPRVGDDGVVIELVAIDVASGDTVVLPESRMVEDQVEWLDDDTIIYAMPHAGQTGGPQPAMDLWALDLAPGATPRLFLPYASSPGVIATDGA